MFVYPYHFDQETNGKGKADEHDETGRKKGHDKIEWIIKGIGCPHEVNAKDQEKN